MSVLNIGELKNDSPYSEESPNQRCRRQSMRIMKKEVRDRNRQVATETKNSSDLSTSIGLLLSLFPVAEQSTRDELEAFLNRLQPILDQMFPSDVPWENQAPALFATLTGRAHVFASSKSMAHTDIYSSIHQFQRKRPLDHSLRKLKLCRWNAVALNTYKQTSQSTHQDVSACNDYFFNIIWILQTSCKATSASSNSLKVYSGTSRDVERSIKTYFSMESSTFPEMLKNCCFQ